MNKTYYQDIDETVYHETLNCGLDVFILPKKGFMKTYASLSTHFGSIHTKLSSQEDIPHGVAHFLEHKLFERQNEDVSKQFAMQQASVNAFTQNDRTTYLFSCTDHVIPNVKLLLDFVFNPEFTIEGIEKEKDIITQEINMYLDNPHTQCYMGIMRNLFPTHPVRNEILGSEESIRSITRETLIKTHNLYYHPSNMVLFVTGNVDPEEVLSHIRGFTCDKVLQHEIPIIQKADKHIASHYEEQEYDIMLPNQLLGVKLPSVKKKDVMKYELALSVLMDLIIGKTTNTYNKLVRDGLINDSFGLDIQVDDTYSYLVMGSESTKPKVLDRALRDILLDFDVKSIKEEDFIRTKKQTLGSYIHALNSLEFIANSYVKYHFQHNSLFAILDVSRDVTIEDLHEVYQWFINEEYYTTYIGYPKKNEN